MNTRTYRLNFPSDLDADQVATWLRACSGTLTTGPRRLLDVSSMVFEVEAGELGISYRLVVPDETADFLTGQLRALVPGSSATPAGADDRANQWTAAVELGQTNPRRSLGTVNAEATSASLLASFHGLGRGEALLLQWVVSPALRQRPPQQAGELVLPGRRFASRPDRDRINDLRAKLSEPNFAAASRTEWLWGRGSTAFPSDLWATGRRGGSGDQAAPRNAAGPGAFYPTSSVRWSGLERVVIGCR